MKISRQKLRRMILEVMSLSEHRIKPPKLTPVPGVISQDQIDKIYFLINSGNEIDKIKAQIIIDSFPELKASPDYVKNYIAYEEVGDMEKLGNQAAAIYDDAYFPDKKHKDRWYETDAYGQIKDLDSQAYRLGKDKVARGEAPSARALSTEPDYSYMRNRYHDLRQGSVKPLKENNSSRAGLRRMILQEMSNMGGTMSIDAMMQELQRIEAQLEEMEMQREEWIANESRYTGDEVEAAYGYEMEYPDYYDDKEELQSRAYELEEMIEAAGGPTL